MLKDQTQKKTRTLLIPDFSRIGVVPPRAPELCACLCAMCAQRARRSKKFILARTGEIQKGTGGRGRDRKCHKLSWRLSQIVVTFYDDLWRFMTFYDVLCQWNKETEIVIKCRKLSWHIVNCRDVCRKLSWHFFSRPLPAVPFWISPIERIKKKKTFPRARNSQRIFWGYFWEITLQG